MFLAISLLSSLVGLGFAGAVVLLPDIGIDGRPGAFLAVLGVFVVTLALGSITAERGTFKARGVLSGVAATVRVELVAAPAMSIPAVFTRQGADYVVWAVGGKPSLKPKVADQLVTYSLPAKE